MPTPAWLKQVPVAHRGLHHVEKSGIPENSLAAFGAAITKGYAMELDVRLSKDRVAMVFHDAKLDRLAGVDGNAADLTAAEFKRLRLLGTQEAPPTLAEVLAFVAGRSPILIEIKNYGAEPVGPLEEAVASALDGYTGPYALQSFSPGVVDWARRHLPSVARGQIATLPEEMNTLDDGQRHLLREALDNDFGAPDFVAFDVRYLPQPITVRAKAAGKPVLSWTVRSSAIWADAKSHADNPIFEHWLP